MRRFPRIARIAPIGVPAGLDRLLERKGQRLARRDGRALGDQAQIDMGRGAVAFSQGTARTDTGADKRQHDYPNGPRYDHPPFSILCSLA